MFLEMGRITRFVACASVMLVGCASDDAAPGRAHGALSTAQCDYFSVGGTVTICHATGSSRNPVQALRVATQACVNGHAGHSGDFIAVNGSCGADACLPVGAPVDSVVPCCSIGNVTAAGGVCACAAGWADCDHSALSGCEVALDTTSDCGACGHACSVAHGTPACTAGACGVASCDTGYHLVGGACVDVDECADAQTACGAHATCTNAEGSYACACDPGYDGTSTTGTPARCTNHDDCTAGLCQNGGTCTDGLGSYTCACAPGFTGTHCETSRSTCPTGSSAFEGRCYQYVNTLPSPGEVPFNYWLYADGDCAARFPGGRLASIGSAAENTFVRSFSPTGGIMIGFSDAGRPTNNFVWLDGSPVTYTNWSPGEPNSRGVNRFGTFLTEDWATLNLDGTWNDLPFTDGGAYVCKFTP